MMRLAPLLEVRVFVALWTLSSWAAIKRTTPRIEFTFEVAALNSRKLVLLIMAAAAPPPGLLESISKCERCKAKAIHPMVLSCLHSCCSECVTTLLKDGVITCPQCKKTVTVRGENGFLEMVSQIFTPDEATPKCQICESRGIERNATQVCLRCPPPNHFCDECTGLHTLFLPDKIHRLVTCSDFMESGGVHPRDFPVTMCACCSKSKPEVSCRGCMQSLCLKCGVARSCTKGGKHDIEDESAIVERHRQDIRQEMDNFTQNSDSISEQIEETEALLKKTEGDNKRSVNKLKQHHSRLLEEMRNQEELLQELCQSSVVEIVKVLSQMTEARDASIRGAKAGQRALDFSPDDLMGAALADVKTLPRLPPPTHQPLKTSVLFEEPDAAEVSDLWKCVMGSVFCNKICKSWPTMSQPYVRRHTVTLPSGRGAVLELADEEGFYRVSARNQISVFGRGTKETICSDHQEVPGLSLDLVSSDKAAQQKSAEPRFRNDQSGSMAQSISRGRGHHTHHAYQAGSPVPGANALISSSPGGTHHIPMAPPNQGYPTHGYGYGPQQPVQFQNYVSGGPIAHPTYYNPAAHQTTHQAVPRGGYQGYPPQAGQVHIHQYSAGATAQAFQPAQAQQQAWQSQAAQMAPMAGQPTTVVQTQGAGNVSASTGPTLSAPAPVAISHPPQLAAQAQQPKANAAAPASYQTERQIQTTPMVHFNQQPAQAVQPVAHLPKRERKPLLIVNPSTHEEVDLSELAKKPSSASTTASVEKPEADVVADTPALPNPVAEELKKMVTTAMKEDTPAGASTDSKPDASTVQLKSAVAPKELTKSVTMSTPAPVKPSPAVTMTKPPPTVTPKEASPATGPKQSDPTAAAPSQQKVSSVGLLVNGMEDMQLGESNIQATKIAVESSSRDSAPLAKPPVVVSAPPAKPPVVVSAPPAKPPVVVSAPPAKPAVIVTAPAAKPAVVMSAPTAKSAIVISAPPAKPIVVLSDPISKAEHSVKDSSKVMSVSTTITDVNLDALAALAPGTPEDESDAPVLPLPAAPVSKITESAGPSSSTGPSTREESPVGVGEDSYHTASETDTPADKQPSGPAPVQTYKPTAPATVEPVVKPSVLEKDRKAMPPPAVIPPVQSESEEKISTPSTTTQEQGLKNGDSSSSEYAFKPDPDGPINSEAKKAYDREFLLNLQFKGRSMRKPEGLPNFSDIVLDKPLQMQGGMQGGMPRVSTSDRMMNNDFTPSYVRGISRDGPPRDGPSPRGTPMGKRGSQQRDMRGGDRDMRGGDRDMRGGHPAVRKIELKREDIKLNTTENAWSADVKLGVPSTEETEEEKIETMFKEFRAILNKLTPQKFESLIKKIKLLQITTETRLRGIVDLVFEKALDEPGFSVTYARMCYSLTSLNVPMDVQDAPGRTMTVTFRKVLLLRCQKEFEKDSLDEKEVDQRKAAIEKAEGDEKKLLQEALQSFVSKAKRRSLGNIRFIGELFKLQMLTENIMHSCIITLLKTDKDEESLECLCRLLTTIGKEIDIQVAKVRNDQYFKKLESIATKKQVCSRVCFMIQDLLDLRKSNWVPRQGDKGPKTIEQIHKEAKLEDLEKATNIRSYASFSGMQGGGGGGGGMRQGGNSRDRDRERGAPPKPEDWQTTTIPNRAQYNKIDNPNKLQLSKGVDLGSTRLGPSQNRGTSWGKGAIGSRGSGQARAERPSTPVGSTTTNRFAMLGLGDDSNTDTFRSGNDRSDRSGGGGSGRGTPPIRGSKEERSAAIDHVKNLSQRGDPSGGAMPRNQSMPELVGRSEKAPLRPSGLAAPPKPAGMSEDAMRKKTRAMVDEYINIKDVGEVILSLQEMGEQSNLHLFIDHALMTGVEFAGKDANQARNSIATLLKELLLKKAISLNVFSAGLSALLAVAADLATDVPQMWKYLGQMLGPAFLHAPPSALSLMSESTKPLMDPDMYLTPEMGLASSLMVEIALEMGKESQERAGEQWTASGLKWSMFLGKSQDVSEFVAEKKVAFLEAQGPDPMKVLHKMVVEGETNEAVNAYLDKNLTKEQRSQPIVVRKLMTAVCHQGHRKWMSEKEPADQLSIRAAITNRLLVLKRLIDNHQKEHELQAVFSVQAFVHHLNHPPKMLSNLFNQLYDDDVISEDSFLAWTTDDRKEEDAGKGVALASSKPFFEWLNEAEPTGET